MRGRLSSPGAVWRAALAAACLAVPATPGWAADPPADVGEYELKPREVIVLAGWSLPGEREFSPYGRFKKATDAHKGRTHHQAMDLARHPEKAKPTQKKLRAKDRPLINDQPTAYVCRRYVCQLPVTDPAGLVTQLDAGV